MKSNTLGEYEKRNEFALSITGVNVNEKVSQALMKF